MVMLTDLLERKRALEEENARIQRDLRILRQIDELAAQLEEPHIPSPPPYEGDEEVEVPVTRIAVEATTAAPETETDAPPAEPPKPPPPAPPAAPAPEPAAKAKPTRNAEGAPYVSPTMRAKVLGALEDGPLLMPQLTKKADISSGSAWRATQALLLEGKIVEVGHGGFQNRSPRFALKERKAEPTPLTPRVRKVIEKDAKRAAKKGPTQPATHEGRILSLLQLHNAMTVSEMAAELSIPASTVGRLVGKLKDEGEVAMGDRGYVSRTMVFA